METQHEFIERRRLAHEEAAREAENDPLIQELFGPKTPYVVSERERRDYCLPPGWMFRRQAGDPLDAPVSSGDTVTAVTSSRGSRDTRRKNRRRRYFVRLAMYFHRSILRVQRGFERLTCPAR